ncbi:pentapeptide repeat-containing protein [Nocardia farcinica]|uniref:pentapeptide repeat-containing protein n=2 Tax=Nocardia farcinica TaxID=37329 RepID=UPI001893655E|nr:pentapeptide repeat-containing protein [Nocardia farcinica]MBF6139020.1 pentapeptide repeat-containing protein [Nocardia farcinica]MBF6443692.1 pentapeptide repeat-containing protein [Nocardia farcinica]
MAVTRMQVTPARPKLGGALRDAGPGEAFGDELTVAGVRYTGGAAGAEGGDVIAVSASEFSGARLVGSLTRTTFDNCVFDSSDLAGLRADETSFLESAIAQSRLTGLSLTDGVLRDVTVEDTRADLASFRGSKFQKVVFTGCNLAGADFQRVRFRSVRFEGCDLTGAQFSQASIEHNTTFADCRMVDVRGVRGLKGAHVRGDDLLGLAASLAREVGIEVDW